MKTLLQGKCLVRCREKDGALTAQELDQLLDASSKGWYSAALTENVHEILLREGVIHDPRIDNRCAELKWIGEKDWIYRYEFEQAFLQHPKLIFKGLDTFVDVYLNRTFLQHHDNMNLPLEIPVSEIQKSDVLLLHFHSAEKVLASVPMQAHWEGLVDRLNLIRKHKHDFTTFSGQNPYLSLVGPFDDIFVETWEKAAFAQTNIGSKTDGKSGTVSVSADISGTADAVRVKIFAPDGSEVQKTLISAKTGTADAEITLSDVQKWYPRGYGEQNLYTVMLELLAGETILDCHESMVGFCSIKIDDNFKILCNGERIRLWGANLTPPDGWTHRWDSARFSKLMDLAENGNMNLIRVWGGGFAYPDALYAECSRRGILVWQDFVHDYGMYPETEEYTKIFLTEAEYMVRRLRHFPCMLLWCGGNETFLGAEYLHPEAEYRGAELFLEYYRNLCARLDPERRYWCNSPSGGNYPNDPTQGDTHSYSHDWYVPGIFAPQFVSEANRTCIPQLSSLEKMLTPEELWPEGFRDEWTRSNQAFLPEPWKKWMVPASRTEYGYIHNYFDAENPEELIYKFGAAARDEMGFAIENCRRGKRDQTPGKSFVCNGFMLWKLNDSWPSIYCGAIDYFLSPTMVYYTLKESFSPVMLSFEGTVHQDHIALWGVNDSGELLKGTLKIRVLELATGKEIRTVTRDVTLPAHDSVCITGLDFLGQLRRTWILAAELTDRNDVVRAVKTQLLDAERRCAFPKATLSIEKHADGAYAVTTDAYAHCVCLSGKTEDGETLVFSDNYFSLLPGQTRVVTEIRGRCGAVTGHDIYGPTVTA